MKRRSTLVIVLLVLLVVQGVLNGSVIYPEWKQKYAPKNRTNASGLDPAYFAFALGGFREFIAGLLWVRADKFFDEGNYDAVLPIIRLVTLLDPHEIDVYATGMWHIGYNFTDTEQRSDRRYIPVALAFGEEGANNNPDTYEMYFETGWLWYHKIDDDYDNAVYWWEKAATKDDMPPARHNLLSMAYQRDGRIQDAINLYFSLYDKAVAEAKENKGYASTQNSDTIEGNIDTMLVRMSQRGWFAQQRGDFDKGDYDTKPPYDVKFSAKATVEDPAVIHFEGTWDVLPVGTHIRVVLKDDPLVNDKGQDVDEPGGMKWKQETGVNFDTPRQMTIMQDGLFVRDRRFSHRIDMSNDRTMYPFKSKNYVVEFYYNPRSSPPHLQDKFGWNGEGITDSNFLNTEIRPKQRVIFARLKLTRDQILRLGEWSVKTPVVETPNYQKGQLLPTSGGGSQSPLRAAAAGVAPASKAK
jgi:hypothetical protein